MNDDEPTGNGRQEPPPPGAGSETPHPAPSGVSSPLDAEAARAIEEARRAFLVAAEKAGIAARALSSQVRAGAADAFEELTSIARAAHDRVRELAADAAELPAPGAPRRAARRGETPGSPSRLAPHQAGTLAYAGWAMTGILFYLLSDRRERFVRFHALQSILLTAALAIMGGSALAVPLVGKVLFSMAAIGFFLVWLLAMRKAFRHERYLLPFIGEIARAHVERLADERR